MLQTVVAELKRSGVKYFFVFCDFFCWTPIREILYNLLRFMWGWGKKSQKIAKKQTSKGKEKT